MGLPQSNFSYIFSDPQTVDIEIMQDIKYLIIVLEACDYSMLRSCRGFSTCSISYVCMSV